MQLTLAADTSWYSLRATRGSDVVAITVPLRKPVDWNQFVCNNCAAVPNHRIVHTYKNGCFGAARVFGRTETAICMHDAQNFVDVCLNRKQHVGVRVRALTVRVRADGLTGTTHTELNLLQQYSQLRIGVLGEPCQRAPELPFAERSFAPSPGRRFLTRGHRNRSKSQPGP